MPPALQPRARRNARGLGSSPFARRYSGSHCCFPFLRLLRCFSSAGSPPLQSGCRASSAAGCPIRTSADHRPTAPPRGFSQPSASFFASGSQGILRAPSGTCRVPRPSADRASRRRGTDSHPRARIVILSFRFLSLEIPPAGHKARVRCLFFRVFLQHVKEPPDHGSGTRPADPPDGGE